MYKNNTLFSYFTNTSQYHNMSNFSIKNTQKSCLNTLPIPFIVIHYHSLPMIYIRVPKLHGMSTQTQSSNVYSMYKQNVQKYFENISKVTSEYFQAFTQLQNECIKTCEKTINASISTQQVFSKKAGISSEIPDSVKTAIVSINKQIVQASTLNNQLTKTAIDTTVQNIQTFSNNINSFAELNNNIIQSWTTPFTLKI